MKNPLDRDDFEIFLEEEANQHRMYPSDHIWRNIQQEIHGYTKWPALTVITLFVIAALVVGTVLIKPQHQDAAYIAETIQKAAITQPAQSAAVNVQEQFSPERITQQTIARANGRDDVDGNIILTKNNNPASLPADYAVVSLRDESDINPAAAALFSITGPVAVAEQETRGKENKKDAAQPKNTPVINWINLVPNSSLNLNGQPALNIAGITTIKSKAGSGFMFSLFGKSQAGDYSSLELENNFTEPVHKTFSFKPRSRRFDFAFYATPSISYRRLVYDQNSQSTRYISGLPYNADYKVDMSKAIRHKPAVGYEVGAALGYKLNSIITLRGGFQFNVREYDIVAYKQNSSVSSFSTLPTNTISGVDVSNQAASGIDGGDKAVLQNRYYEISMPLGIDVTAWKRGRFGWGVATSVQPTYTFDKDPFIITSDYKNYIDGSKLVRNWNVNGNIETYISYSTGQFKWQLGPQFRYQFLPTLSGGYPTREHLLDYGLKIGFVKSLP